MLRKGRQEEKKKQKGEWEPEKITSSTFFLPKGVKLEKSALCGLPLPEPISRDEQ